MDYFNQLAVEFDREPERIERTSKTGDAIMKELRLSSDSRVMDYGAGTGLLTFKLQPHAGSITAVDFSDAMLEVIAKKIARSHVENIQCLKWNVETDEYLPSSFDVLIGSMVLHHIYDVQRALDRFAMMLTEHGQIAVADLD
ncbi:MAG: class I SAM-dependent methyltransferase, partial [Candidatus Hinthialibacter sp.]